MLRKIAIAAALITPCVIAQPTKATTCASLTSIVNTTPADAGPVMNNFNSLLACANASAPLASPAFTGSVGIGTASPTSALEVRSTGTGFGSIKVFSDTYGGYIGNTAGSNAGNLYLTPASGTLDIGDGGSSINGVGIYNGATRNIQLNSNGNSYFNGGNLGIGTTSPGRPLDIEGAGTAGIRLGHTGYNYWDVLAQYNYTNADLTFLMAGVEKLRVNANGEVCLGYTTSNCTGSNSLIAIGNVGIGTASPATALHVVGTIRQTNCTTAGTLSANASGDIICSSDARLKNILGDYSGGLEALAHINPKLFTYKPTKSDPVETFVHAGFTAQNVMAVIPQASALQRDGYYSLDTTAVLAAAVNSIKQLKTTTDRQAAEISRLKTRLVQDEIDLAAIRARLGMRSADAAARPRLTAASYK